MLQKTKVSGLIRLLFTVWIEPVKDTLYPVYNDSFSIRTEGVAGQSHTVMFRLFTDGGYWITDIAWTYENWGYAIRECTSWAYDQQLAVVAQGMDTMIWEVTHTTEDLTIKCNGVEVLHFIYTNQYNASCIATAKGKEVSDVEFLIYDDATKEINFTGK